MFFEWLKNKNKEKFFPITHAKGVLFGDNSESTVDAELAKKALKENPVFTGSVTEGADTTAVGINSHAEGENTIARGDSAHTEGEYTIASGSSSHAEGDHTEASGESSHAEGEYTIASGVYSHAEGLATTASGEQSHAEGFNTTASGNNSHVEGNSTNKASSKIDIVNSTNAQIITAWTTNKFSLAKGVNSHVEGSNCLALVNNAHAEGEATIANGLNSHAEGVDTTASADYSHAEGIGTTASGECAHAEGVNTTASGEASHAEGEYTIASGVYSHAEGSHIEALQNQHAQGHYNDTSLAIANTLVGTSTGTAFVIGNGTSTTRSNAFRVTGEGATYAKSAYNATGADYAEYAEWADGNPDSEDRRGYFVTFDETHPNMIRKANDGDYILGVVSGNPCIIGNSDESWLGRYMFDEFGAIIYEEIEVDESYTDEETGEILTRKIIATTYKENPDYDPEITYVHRKDRKEWSCIGWIGVLSVRDDGTCLSGSYCNVTSGGIATNSERGLDTYRVLERISENVIKIAVR